MKPALRIRSAAVRHGVRALAAVLWLAAVAAPASAAAQPSWPSEGAPRPLAARGVRFPPYDVRTLPNGLQVVAVLQHEQPIVSMRLIVRAGSARDPRDKAGLAHLLASLLDQGTATMSALDMNDAIDFVGGEMNAGAGTDLSFMHVVVMKDSFDVGLRMLSDMARHPAFAPEELERQRQQMLSTLRVQATDPDYIANGVFDRVVYGLHPYGLPDGGTPTTLASITRGDLVAFHDRYFVPNNAILAVVGDLSAEEAFDGAAKAFGDWARGEVPATSFTAPPQPARRVIVINRPDAVQTEIRIGHLGVKRNLSDYMPLNLALRILGGEGANRLHQVLRTERSLTYGAQANMHTLREAGDFEAETSTRTEATGEAVRLIMDEFWRLQHERVNERELAGAKAYLTGSFPLTIETPDQIATQVLNVLFFGLPPQELQSFRDRVNAITVDEIERVSRYYLRADRLAIVLVGNAAAIAPQLRKIGLGTFDTIDEAELDLTATDFKASGTSAESNRNRTPARPAAGHGGDDRQGQAAEGGAGHVVRAAYLQQPDGIVPQEGAPAQALLDKVIAAKGGLDVLRGVKNIVATTEADTDTPNGRVQAKTTTYLQYPNRVRVETTIPGGTVTQIYDGIRAWVKDARGVHDVPQEMARELDASFARDVISLLLAAHDGRVRPRLLPDVRAEDRRTYRVMEFSSPSLEPTILYIDPDTNLVARQSYVAGGRAAPAGRGSAERPIVEEIFSDYRAVSGVQVAFTALVRQGGQPVLERHVTDIRINAPLDPSLFTRPAP